MGRGKVTFKRISNERSRKTTFIQRKKGLTKKISEFCTICGVEACLILHADGNGDTGLTTWPQDSTVVHSIIQKYEQSKNEGSQETFEIQDFFENRKKMVEAEISKVRKEITDIKYPTWNPCIINMEEEHLRAFLAHVDAKIGVCEQRINMIKNKHQSEANSDFMQNMAHFHPNQIIPTPVEPVSENNMSVKFTNSSNQFGCVSNHGINMQQGDAFHGGDSVIWANELADFEKWFNELDDCSNQQDDRATQFEESF
ncbi:agamous-like MADS-box protein AGL82 [Cajanus cajan]|uniref:MADS-box transcription factor PHERES 2 n=1 Tax=Cajanus cajan TaxID=3821 RepID=A0A151RE42_CAJCA|nr:agamous-like MADS-box protein AGL82 [Cajanus cajan]KYP40749.1 MADS-box transcription factor PHERES 2 [Cajanus cajan]